jgi:hypothetical protein
MKNNKWLMALGLGLGLTLAMLWLLAGQTDTVRADSGVLYVAPDGDDVNDCSTIALRCRTVQRAVNLADDGDTIKAATGIYTDADTPSVGYVVALTKAVTLRGGYDAAFSEPPDPAAHPTILDAERLGRVVVISGPVTVTLEGFILTGGNATGLGGHDGEDAGGGLYVSGATLMLQSNVITDNVASRTGDGNGGGAYLTEIQPGSLISGNHIISNTASTVSTGSYYGYGGGLYLLHGAATFIGNTVRDNIGGKVHGNGGGLMLKDSNTLLESNTVMSNTASLGPAGSGGGVYIWYGYHAILRNNDIISNTACAGGSGHGGGVLAASSTITLTGNTIRGNVGGVAGSGYGGGVKISYGLTVLTDNTIQGNIASQSTSIHDEGKGGGLYAWTANLTLSGNRILSNTASTGAPGNGGGVWLSQNVGALSGNLIQGNVASESTQSDDYGWGGGLYISDSDVTIHDNTIVGNIGSAGGRGGGGGLHLRSHDPDHPVTGNLIQNNIASMAGEGSGGGVFLYYTGTTLDANRILSNTATLSPTAPSQGGGLYVFTISPFQLTNNFIAANRARAGGGVYVKSSPAWHSQGDILHNTFVGNQDSALSVSGEQSGHYGIPYLGPWVLTNTILADHTWGITATAESPYTVTIQADHTLWWNVPNRTQATGPGTVFITTTNDIEDNPAFADPATFDYHIGPTSPACDAGVEAGVTTDIDGEPRPGDGVPDIGADEYVFAGLEFSPDWVGTIRPTQAITYSHTLTNTGNATDTVSLQLTSSRGWATLLTGSPVAIGQNQTATVQVRVEVPAGTLSDTVETAMITATSGLSVALRLHVTDTTTVAQAPGLILTPSAASQTGDVGTTVTYTLHLTNTGNAADSFDLVASGNLWPTAFSADLVGPLAVGARAEVAVYVNIPDTEAEGAQDVVTVTATSLADGNVRAQSVLTTTAHVPRFYIHLPLVMKNYAP